MLSLLTEERISFVVAEQVRQRRPEIRIESVRGWQGGAFEGVPDEVLRLAAREAGLTLITYDQKTIPPLLLAWGTLGQDHAGVLFTDNFTIAQSDIGGLVRALIARWDETKDWDWTNRIDYLHPAPG
jgi:hypothetical protein